MYQDGQDENVAFFWHQICCGTRLRISEPLAMARDTKKTDPKAIFSLWMPRRKSPIYKLPVLIQFQVAADNGEGIVYGGYQRGDARRPAGAVSQDSVAKRGRQHPLGVWDEPCL